MKKNNTISPWLGTLNLVTPTSYEANGGLRRDVDYFQHRRVNRTLCFTSHQQVVGGFSEYLLPRRTSDCLGCEDLGQQLMGKYRSQNPKSLSVVRARQSLPPIDGSTAGFNAAASSPGRIFEAAKTATMGSVQWSSGRPIRPLITAIVLVITTLFPWGSARAELFDSLDAYPPRWQLDTSDCDARVIDHKNLASGGVDDRGCESLTYHAGVGSESILVYPIEPVHAINDLIATVSVMSARRGSRIGLRVRFPYVRDPHTYRPIAVIIYGAVYDRPGKFQSLGIGSIERELRVKVAKMRAEHGAAANLNDPYVDAVAINAYSGPGMTTLRIDQISVRGMIPLGDHGRVNDVPSPRIGNRSVATGDQTNFGGSDDQRRVLQMRLPSSRDGNGVAVRLPPPFPQSDVIRILEHQGEPLAWIRSLGFDAILLSRPPNADILREAIKSQLLIYAPPPVAPDPAIQNLLDPVMAWYLGGGVALDKDRVSQTDLTVRRLRAFPSVWQRPVVIAPVESWTGYATIADAIVSDAALRGRGLPAAEQALDQAQRLSRIGSRIDVAVAIESSSPSKLAAMNQAIESAIGAPPGGNFRWHSMLTQVVQSLEQSPRAIVFRSHDSLVSGSTFAHQRSMALSYINRFVAMISPWLASARPADGYPMSGAPYRCGRLDLDGSQFLMITSDSTFGDQVLAGDGRAIDILLPPEMINRTAWRLTDFAAQRVTIDRTSSGARIQIVSPDVAEIIVISSDASLGARLNQSAKRFSAKAASDRWQLCGDHVSQIRRDWESAVTSGATEAIMPIDLLTAARRTLLEAETVYRAGDAEATLRLSRRADAWAARAGVQLSQALLPTDDLGSIMRYISSPPNDEGRPILQTAWQPLMRDEGWSKNLIASGGLDQPGDLAPNKWTFGRRKLARSDSDASWVSRGFFSGRGAVRLSAASTTGEPLGGGYEGTIAILSSPVVKLQSNQAVRVDVMIRTIGFGAPHQGILVYDSLGGQEMGLLVRGATDWTPVRLYRQSSGDTEMTVMFEVIGDGEAVVDEISVRAWTPDPLPALPPRSISP